MSTPRRCLQVVLLVIFWLSIHFRLAAQSDADVNASIRKFTQVFEAVETNFADRMEPDNVVFRGAIPSMLRTLDPHSNFFDPKAYQLMREGQSGHYFGVGMYVGAPEGRVIVMYPFEGSPAFRAGLRPGDEIVSVNDNNTEHATVTEVSGMLKGRKGTPERNSRNDHRQALRDSGTDAFFRGSRQRSPRHRKLCVLDAARDRIHAHRG